MLRVTPNSVTKSRDGRRLDLVLGFTSRVDGELKLALDVTQGAVLVDNVGAAWRFVGVSGLSRIPPVASEESRSQSSGSAYLRARVGGPGLTLFERGAEHPVILTFESEGSAGVTFSFSAALRYERTRKLPPSPHTWEKTWDKGTIPLGLTGLAIR